MRSTKRTSAARASASKSSSVGKRADGGARFATRVLSIIRRIPVGRVTTYGDVAALAGKPRAARAVGNIMREAHEPGLPYHRVIGAGGGLGGYSSLALKRQLLAAEGLVVTATKVKNFAKVRWPQDTTSPRRTRRNTKKYSHEGREDHEETLGKITKKH